MRDAADVGDARWIDAFRAVLPRRVATTDLGEVVVMDTMEAALVVLADVAPPRMRDADLPLVPAIEMAAAG